MLQFLINEQILTIGSLSGIFTATLIGSFKSNIVEPVFEKLVPSSNLDNDKKKINDYLNANNYGNTQTRESFTNDKIKWQTFIKDLLQWFIIIFIIYLIYKFIKYNFIKKNVNN